MSWETHPSQRKATLPPGWDGIQKRIIRRDKRCQWGSLPSDRAAYGQCLRKPNQADHKDLADDHRDSNLRALCAHHHAIRSGRQGAQALASIRIEQKKRVAVKRESRNRHPGLIEPPPDHPSQMYRPHPADPAPA